jgi:hypothetical protein
MEVPKQLFPDYKVEVAVAESVRVVGTGTVVYAV